MRDSPSDSLLLKPRRTPLIIGHRGSSAVAPENTIAAFARSLRDGADGFEFDVRLARDGVHMVIHDATLRRTAAITGAVSDFTSRELQQVDVGSWFNLKRQVAARPEYAAENVPTLEQVLNLNAGTEAILYLEMKSDENEVEPLAGAVDELLRKHSFGNRVIVESFNLAAIKAVKLLDPNIPTAALFEPSLERPSSLLRKMKTVELAVAAGANEIALHHSLAAKRVTEKAAQSNLPVVVWTVDHPVWLRRSRARGIHALMTNDPAHLVSERSRLFGV
jgi:glycerophosphoryl diester phosphodiesterase